MAGKSPHEAVSNFLHPIQSVIACFSDAVLDHKGGYEVGHQHVVLLHDDQSIPLRGPSHLSFYFSHRYEVVRVDDQARGPWKVKTLGYRYHVNAEDGSEVVSYHWHPDGKWKFPHLHMPKIKAHYPTSRIAVEDVLEFAVRDLGAQSLPGRIDDWEKTLRGTKSRFMMYKTW